MSQTAKTIMSQLGGNRFSMMTGAKNYGWNSETNTLSFKIGRNCASVNHVTIELKANDTYKMTFLKISNGLKRGFQKKVIEEFDGIYCDQLQELFTKTTGMYTRM